MKDISGPDEDGRLALVVIEGGVLLPPRASVRWLDARTHASDAIHICRVGALSYPRPRVALSPKGGKIGVACESSFRVVSMEGSLIDELRVESVGTKPCWTQDGRRVLFARRLSVAECPVRVGDVQRSEKLATARGGIAGLNVVEELDVEARTTRFVAFGDAAVVGPDDRSLLVFDDERWWTVDLATGARTETAAEFAGAWGRSMHGFVGERCVLIEAFATEGMPQHYLGWGMTFPRWSWALKVFDLDRGGFSTVVPELGYDPVSFATFEFAPLDRR